MNFTKSFGYKKELAEKGNWFDIFGFKIKLAYSNQLKLETIANELRGKKKQELNRELNDEELTEIGNEIFCEHCLIDWQEGATFEDEQGNEKPFPCTKENKLLAMNNEVFVKNVLFIAQNHQNFQKERIEERVKK